MDMFYGAPRQPPAPPTINNIHRIPSVPEVSVVEDSFFASNMKSQNANNSVLMSKKHVRFKNSYPEPIFGKENVPQNIKTMPDLNGKTFKQIYMANVPDRHLDLSLFEPSIVENTPNISDKLLKSSTDHSISNIAQHKNYQNKNDSIANYADFKHKQLLFSNQMCNAQSRSNENPKLKSINNIFPSPQHVFKDDYSTQRNRLNDVAQKESPKRLEICTQTEVLHDENCRELASSNDEPTIKDLFKIIQQQNEQIMQLQRQINNLKTSIRQPEIDSIPHELPQDRPFLKDVTNSPTKKGLFSFDVKATSFEFSFRPQPKFWKQNDFMEPKIQEIVECDAGAETQNSLRLDESLHVKDSYVSEAPSIDIKMDEYQSSDDEDDPKVNNIGLTFYKDLMEQVSNVLKKVQKQSECQMGNRRQDLAGQTMKAVKQATLQHLQNIGVNLPPIHESTEDTGSSGLNSENEISCVVQQLLMKYLPEDKLVKAINRPKEQPINLQEKTFKPPNSEFSFATLQYMKKYNLLDNTRKTHKQKQKKKVSETNPKILDVTALKLQPKLL